MLLFVMFQELDKLKTSSKSKQKQQLDDVCSVHNAPLYYYCITDSESICSDCAMFDKKVFYILGCPK